MEAMRLSAFSGLGKHTLAFDQHYWRFPRCARSLYPAYDLLGGEHGPLRTLTRAITYGALFGTGSGLDCQPVPLHQRASERLGESARLQRAKEFQVGKANEQAAQLSAKVSLARP